MNAGYSIPIKTPIASATLVGAVSRGQAMLYTLLNTDVGAIVQHWNNNTAINRAGAQLDFQIPIFDTGEARERKARESYMAALNRLAAKAVNARSEARIAYDTYRGTYDIAKFYRDRVLPLRQIVSQEVALRYSNGILAGEGLRVDLFKYLIDARVRIGANAAALDARRDFYLAAADLQAALSIGRGGSAGGEPAGPASSPAMQ